MRRFHGLTALLLVVVLTGCSTTTDPDATNDPAEGFNRGVYAFNEELDTYVLKPASEGWTRVTTSGVRRGVDNFFSNLQAPGYILNDALQGKAAGAGRQSVRFVMNSTVGVLGIFDPADAWLGLEPRPEDFGQTLGVWGANSGPYLVLPLFGPSNGRDVTQYPVAHYTNLMTYIALDTLTMGSLTAINVVNTRARADGAAQLRDDSAVDPYVFTRSAYRQYRQDQIYDGNPPLEDDPYAEFFDEMDSDSNQAE
ncbi:MlaA family lipoprotein [Spiribacter salinus]|jgi:phospholipid-binding lipoprotein MlaA|uniref:MlaA family lipoprotein n=1 Tax=Spiribacter salinus TaxID=1335746 RepID=UPI001C94FC14|nr:VacJ family lipoprotein [Spiribacter salinus]MBY5269274.1 VacJ-like lipoprotein [Spiribacter salinus]